MSLYPLKHLKFSVNLKPGQIFKGGFNMIVLLVSCRKDLNGLDFPQINSKFEIISEEDVNCCTSVGFIEENPNKHSEKHTFFSVIVELE